MNTTKIILPPEIRLSLDPLLLLSTLGRYKWRLDNQIVPLAMKKFAGNHPCVGKQNQFEKLYDKFMEIYVRKEAKEADYQAKNQEALKKRPHLSASDSTFMFKAF